MYGFLLPHFRLQVYPYTVLIFYHKSLEPMRIPVRRPLEIPQTMTSRLEGSFVRMRRSNLV